MAIPFLSEAAFNAGADFKLTEIKNVLMQNLASASITNPSAGTNKGKFVFNTTANVAQIWNGNSWTLVKDTWVSALTASTPAVTIGGSNAAGLTISISDASGSQSGLLSTTLYNLLNNATSLSINDSLVRRSNNGSIAVNNLLANSVSVIQNALGATTVDGVLLSNSTASTSTVNQVSPAITWSGTGWSGTASVVGKFSSWVSPKGTADFELVFRSDSNKGLSISKDGSTRVDGILTVDKGLGPVFIADPNGYFRFNDSNGVKILEADYLSFNVFSAGGDPILSASRTASFLQITELDLLNPLSASSGGTGYAAYSTGDLLYGSSGSLAKLPITAAGNVLISGATPSWGKVGLSTHVTGTLGVGNGGTGTSSTPSNGNILIGNGAGYTLAAIGSGSGISVSNGSGTISISNTGVLSIAGTTNQVTASGSTGAITLTLPQNIHSGATPTFAGMTLTGGTVTVNTPMLAMNQTWNSAGVTFLAQTVNITDNTSAAASKFVEYQISGVAKLSFRKDGAITVGIWNATAIDAIYGGTGQTSVTTGDLLYGSAANTWGKLAGVATGNVLISGGVGAAPSWGKVALSTHVSGVLSVANGGTGTGTAPTNGQLLIGNGTSYVLAAITQGTGITVTNGAGSITIANAGVTSITGTANQVNASGSTGAITLSLPQSIHTGANPTFAGLTLTTGTLTSGASMLAISSTWNSGTSLFNGIFLDLTVTAALPTSRVVNLRVGSITVFDIDTTGTIKTGSWNGTAVGATYGGTGQATVTTGDLLYGSATNTWSRLSAVATGNVLISGGVGVAPSWNKVTLGTHTTGNYVSTISGTANQVNASASTGAITLSLPQNIHTGATPTFSSLTLGGMTSNNGSLVYVSNGTGLLGASTWKISSSDVDAGGGKLIGLANPTNPQEAATKAYVDSVANTGTNKGMARAATTGVITLSGLQTIDGVALVAGDLVLVKDQGGAVDPKHKDNGLYVVSSGAWTRATTADTSAEVTPGMFVFVDEGTVNSDNGYTLTTNAPITLGVTPLTFTQTSGAGQIIAGNGLSKVGNTLSVLTVNSGRITTSSSGIDLASGIVTAGTYNKITVDTYGRATAGANTTYATTLTANSSTTQFTVTHNLNTRDVIVFVREDFGTSFQQVFVDVEVLTVNTVRITFATAPTTGSNYRAVVMAAF